MTFAPSRLSRRALLASAATWAVTAALASRARAQSINVVLSERVEVTRFIDGETVELLRGRDRRVVKVGGMFQDFTLVAVVEGDAPFAVLEDFTRLDGHLLVVDGSGVRHELPKTAESMTAGAILAGHDEAEVRAAPGDLLADVILAGAGDPSWEAVAALLPPIHEVGGDACNFLLVPGMAERVAFTWDGRTAGLDPAALVSDVEQARREGQVLSGLCGGYLPVLRFVFPEINGTWTEMLAFAPLGSGPCRYRISRVEGGRLAWSRSYVGEGSGSAREDGNASALYADLAALRAGCDALLAPGMKLDVPDERMMNQARLGLLRVLLAPRAEGDGDVTVALAAWGLVEGPAAGFSAWSGRALAGLALDAEGAAVAAGTRDLAQGLIRADRIREALLTAYSAMANLATRGGWLAPDSRDPFSDTASADSLSAQLVCPMIVRWLLAFEDPEAEVLWLGRGMPRAWTADMKFSFVDDVPTRWGRISYAVASHRKNGRINVRVNFPDGGIAAETRIRLRAHDMTPMKRVKVSTKDWDKGWRGYDAVSETIVLPAGMGGEVLIEARY